MPNALLKLLVKDKPLYSVRLYSRKVPERRETKSPRREKQSYSGWDTDWQLKTPRETEDYSRQGATSTQSLQLKPEENNITAEKHQPTRMVGS